MLEQGDAIPDVTLKDAPYHVVFNPGDLPCFRARDIHRLTGTITPDGGKLSAFFRRKPD